jgi:hypothetical protein
LGWRPGIASWHHTHLLPQDRRVAWYPGDPADCFSQIWAARLHELRKDQAGVGHIIPLSRHPLIGTEELMVARVLLNISRDIEWVTIGHQ